MPSLFDQLNTLEDVRSFIAQRQRESEVLEYKQASQQWTNKTRDEISKDISAMANALGGVIIYGIIKDATDQELPAEVDTAPIHPSNISAFDQIVASTVRPLIKGIRKRLLPNANPQIMLIEVPESDDRPHQDLKKHRYYRRSGAHSLPMDHDLVASQFGNRLGPIIDLVPKVVPVEAAQSNEIRLRLELRNTGKRVGREVIVIAWFPPSGQVAVATHSGPANSLDVLYPTKQARQIEFPGVVHPRLNVSVAEFTLTITDDFALNHANDPLIKWVVYADEMIERAGSRTMQELGLSVVVTPAAVPGQVSVPPE